MNSTAWAILIFFIVVTSLTFVWYFLAQSRRQKREFLKKFDVPINSPDAKQKVYFKVTIAQENVILALNKVNMEKVVEDLSKKKAPFLDFLHFWNEQSVPVEIALQKLRYLEFLANHFGFGEEQKK